MTNVRVPATWIAQGYHPRVCARHGEEATAAKPRSFHPKDSAWLLLLPATRLIMVIVGLTDRKTVKGPMPTCNVCAGEQKRDASILVGTWVLAAVLLTVAIVMSSTALAVAFTVALLGGLVLLLLKDRNRVVGRLDKELIWVELRRVHPAYAQLIFQAVHQPEAVPLEGFGPVGAAPAGQAINAPAPTADVPATAAPAGYSPGPAAQHAQAPPAAAAGATILPASRHGRPTAIEHTLLGEQTPQ